MVNAQTWLENSFPNWKTAKTIYGTTDYLRWNLQGTNIQELSGDLMIDNLGDLEELDLLKTGKLDNVTIRNCPKLKIINLGSSGVKKLNLGSGLDGLLRLDVSVDFITDPSRKLSELDLSNVKNLKVLKCHGNLTTKLIGFEKLTQLQHFDTSVVLDAKNVVLIPTKEFSKWKENLDIITNPNSGLDLLKGGSGTDKDEVDLNKLNDYKNRPTQGQLDNANNKVKEYEDGLKAELGLNNSNLNTWRNEIDKLKNPLTSDNSSDKIKAVLGLKPTDNLPSDWDQKIVSKNKYDKIKGLHDIIRIGAEQKVGNDWKDRLEIETQYNKLEQQVVQPNK